MKLGTRGARRLALLLLALGLAVSAHVRLDTSTRTTRGEMFVPSPEHARLSSLGFDALVADVHWLRAVQLVGSAYQDLDGQAATVARLIEVVTALDPWVGHAYRFAAVWLTGSVEEVMRANRVLERGIAYHPEEWRNRHYLGFNHFFYLGDNDRAAEALEPALLLPKAPGYLGGLVAKLRSQREGLETASRFLAQLVESTEDEYARAAYLKALDEVEVERAARFLDGARAEYLRRTGRDIERVEDLARILGSLPPAHPHFADFHWEIDERSGRIVSSFYRGRFEPRVPKRARERRQRWREERESLEEAGT